MAIVLFRRDLRLVDNTAFINAIKEHQSVQCLFVFDPIQLEPQNKFFSHNAFQFLLESLIELNRTLDGKLTVLQLTEDELIKELKHQGLPIYYNKDYTPFAKQRDAKLKSSGLDCREFEDYTLFPIESIKTGSGGFYKVFTPYYNKTITLDFPEPITTLPKYNVITKIKSIDLEQLYRKYDKNVDLIEYGGRKSGLHRIKELDKFENYKQQRDLPIHDTTLLSPHIKFGTISIREVAHRIIELYGKNHELLRQIIWHDFYANLMYFLPESQTLGGSNLRERKGKWNKDESTFQRWKDGTTGIPIVDAGMRQLNITGWMHNRVRMIVCNYLVFYLNIDWKRGEQYFATKLVDYDPSSNNGNWQWNAGVGADRSGYDRIFNPWTQAQKFDPGCFYIKKWIPELKRIPEKSILNWNTQFKDYPDVYHQPIQLQSNNPYS